MTPCEALRRAQNDYNQARKAYVKTGHGYKAVCALAAMYAEMTGRIPYEWQTWLDRNAWSGGLECADVRDRIREDCASALGLDLASTLRVDTGTDMLEDDALSVIEALNDEHECDFCEIADVLEPVQEQLMLKKEL